MAALELELDRSKELEGVAALLGCPFNLFDMVGWLAGCGWVGRLVWMGLVSWEGS
jgi:hypothetical protein